MVLDGGYTCPMCGRRLMRIPYESVVYGTPVYCRKCKVEWFPSIYHGVEFSDDEPFHLLEEDE